MGLQIQKEMDKLHDTLITIKKNYIPMRKNYVLLFFFSLLVGMDATAQTIRYVKSGATGSGTSWDDASGDLQEMINASNAKDQVWVAKGVYKPNRRPDDIDVTASAGDRYKSFLLKAEVSVYGGFAGTEIELIDRDISLIATDNETILSGNIGDQSTNEDNTYHVVTIAGEMGEKTIFDGFTVEDGYTEAISGTPSIVVNGQNIPSTRSPGIIVYFVNFIEFRNLIVRNNTNASPGQNAGAIYMFSGGGGNLRNVKFINNKSLFGTADGGGLGGAMYTYGLSNINCNINFYNVQFIGNEASYRGGGVFMGQYSNLKFYDCRFEGNKATISSGGAFYLGSSSSNADFYNTDFIENQSQTNGGAIYAPNSGRLNITGGTFKNNQAVGTNAGGAVGATATGLIINIKGVTFDGNIAAGSGGGAIYYSSGTYTIEDCKFANNSCSSTGGAIYQAANAIAATKIINCDFENNIAGTNGGAIYLTGASTSAQIISCRILNNISGTSGGAMAVNTNGSLTVINSLMYGNEGRSTSTAGGGGAIYCYATTKLTVINSTIAYNRMKAASGSRTGVAIYLASNSSQATVYNSIIFGNRWGNDDAATLPAHEIFVGTASIATLKNTLTQFFGTNGVNGNTVAPAFAFVSTTPSTSGFLEIDVANPASANVIDKGNIADVPVALDFDALGKTRIHNGIIDIGAVEYMGAAKLEPMVYTVKENLEIGQKLGDNNVVNGDISAISNTPVYSLSNPTSWGIIAGNELGAFVIDPTTGEISVANSVPLDYETIKQFTLTIRLTNGLDEQKLTVIVNIENVAETPSTPTVNNVVHGYVVTTYRPILRGVAEPGSTIVIYVAQRKKDANPTVLNYPYEDDDDANWEYVEYPVKVRTDEENGSWSYRFPEELNPGFTRFKVLAEITIREVDPITGEVTKRIERSPLSGYTTVNLKLYGGGTSGLKPTNVLTPNGDGKNDVWTIENLSVMYPKHDIVIYNKVGKIVFEWSSERRKEPYDSDNVYGRAWDGTYNGSPLPSGTYYYDIRIANDGKIGVNRIKGTITIIKGR